MIYKDVSVKILGVSDYRKVAWSLSRPNSEAKLEDTEVTDFGLHDLKNIAFQLGTSAGFRELLTILRPYSMWSQSSRATKVQDIPIVSYMSSNDKVKSNFERFVKETQRTHQDVGRNYLPLAHYSEYVYQCSIRTIIGVLKSLKILNGFYFDIYGNPILRELGMSVEDLEKSPFPPLYKHYMVSDDWDTGSSSFEGISIVALHVKLSHRAQLVRQSQIKVLDEMWDWVRFENRIDETTLGTTVKSTLVANNDQLKRLSKFRSCLLFDTEAWWPLLRRHWCSTRSLEIFPCNGDKSKCILPYEAKDAELGKFSTTSCPIWDRKYQSLKTRLDYITNREIVDVLSEVLKEIE